MHLLWYLRHIMMMISHWIELSKGIMRDLVSFFVITGYVNEGKSRYNLRFK